MHGTAEEKQRWKFGLKSVIVANYKLDKLVYRLSKSLHHVYKFWASSSSQSYLYNLSLYIYLCNIYTDIWSIAQTSMYCERSLNMCINSDHHIPAVSWLRYSSTQSLIDHKCYTILNLLQIVLPCYLYHLHSTPRPTTPPFSKSTTLFLHCKWPYIPSGHWGRLNRYTKLAWSQAPHHFVSVTNCPGGGGGFSVVWRFFKTQCNFFFYHSLAEFKKGLLVWQNIRVRFRVGIRVRVRVRFRAE